MNKRLAEHIKELGNFGFLPENWLWHHDKIDKLRDIDEGLLKELKNSMHSSKKSLLKFTLAI